MTENRFPPARRPVMLANVRSLDACVTDGKYKPNSNVIAVNVTMQSVQFRLSVNKCYNSQTKFPCLAPLAPQLAKTTARLLKVG